MKTAVLLLGFLSTVIGCQKKTSSITYKQYNPETVIQEPYNKHYSWLNNNIMIFPESNLDIATRNVEERVKSSNKPHQSPF